MHAVRAEIVMLPRFAVCNKRILFWYSWIGNSYFGITSALPVVRPPSAAGA